MHLSVATQLKWRKLLLLIIIWLTIGFVMTLYDHFSFGSEYIASTTEMYSFWKNLLFNMGVAFMGALMGGVFLIFYVHEKCREWPYGKTILAVSLSFVLVVSIITIVTGIIFSLQRSGQSITHPQTVAAFKSFVSDPIHLKNIIWWAPIVALTQFVLQVNDKFGPGILWSFISGKYQPPKEELRIFMFVDIMSSTSLAEKLGNEKYHALLKDFFADITNPILYNKGEIYQYVGDEIVVSWKLGRGPQNNNCLKCFFDMQMVIAHREDKYEKRYGLLPQFKAGLHYGKVIAGEVGIIKRDITYSGDVLNTTARIQSKCNEYHVKIISSDELLNLLPYQNGYQRLPLGDIELKGKGQKVALSTIVQKNK